MAKTAFFSIAFSITFTLLFLMTGTGFAAQPPNLEAETAVLMDQSSGKILYEKNPDKPMYPASTTKIMTALLAVEYGDLDEVITVGTEVLHISWDSSKAGFDVGDTVTLRELIYGLMLPSGNDAAYTIAAHISRKVTGNPQLSVKDSQEFFAALMNQRARELGAENTHFTVPDGYHDVDHYTTARDLGLISRAALNNDFLREVAATSRYVPETWIGPNVRPWGNTNQLVRPQQEFYYESATGFKTGYTGPAGFCMVSSAIDNDMELVAVVLNTSKDGRWQDSQALLEYGFDSFHWQQLVEDDQIIQSLAVTNQNHDQPSTVALQAAQPFGSVFSRDDAGQIKSTVTFREDLVGSDRKISGVQAADTNPTLSAPLEAGQVVGEIVFFLDNDELFRTDLITTTAIAAMPWWRKLLLPGGLFACFILLIFIMRIRKKRNRRRRRQRQRYMTSYSRIKVWGS